MTTYEQALEWATEYFKEKRPDFEPIKLYKKGTDEIGMVVWGDEFVEYDLFLDDFETPTLQLVSIEVTRVPVFQFIIPATKEEFFTVLNILNK